MPDVGIKPIPSTAPPSRVTQHARKPLGLLILIIIYKLVKAILAVSAAVLAYRLGGKNLVAIAHRWLVQLGFDPDGRLGTTLLARLSHFNPQRLYWAMTIFLAYAVLYCVEAVGLSLEKRWAEWLTIGQTAILVPFEVYELILRPGPVKAAALCLSLGVIFYLLRRIRDEEMEAIDPPRRHPPA